jgi:light-harvesting complex I chlorophyll a/b binding protein 1
MNDDRSIALPFDKRPAGLDGSLVGDVGFDPVGFSSANIKPFNLKWYREAELAHGRVAMLAVVGNFFPAWFHFPGNPAFGVPEDAYAALNPYTALSQVPSGAIPQIVLAATFVELARIGRTINGDKEPGDLGLGQTGYNPFGFEYTPEEYREKQLQEIKHCRLGMLGALGILLQAKYSGLGITEQLGRSLSWLPEREILQGPGTLGDYFPPNI